LDIFRDHMLESAHELQQNRGTTGSFRRLSATVVFRQLPVDPGAIALWKISLCGMDFAFPPGVDRISFAIEAAPAPAATMEHAILSWSWRVRGHTMTHDVLPDPGTMLVKFSLVFLADFIKAEVLDFRVLATK
jgi:hypothetical protein